MSGITMRQRQLQDLLAHARDPLLIAAAFLASDEARLEEVLGTIARFDDRSPVAGLEHVVRAEELRRYAAACLKAAMV